MNDQPSVADDVRAAFEAQRDEEPAAEDPPAAEPVTDPEPGPQDTKADDPEAQPRDPETGRFAAKEPGEEVSAETRTAGDPDGHKAGADAEAAPAASPDTSDGAEPLKALPDDELGPLEPPTHWDLESQQTFRRMPEEAQKWMLDREKTLAREFGAKSERLADERKAFEGFNDIVSPELDQRIQLSGLDRRGYFGALAAMEQMGHADPAGFIQWWAEQNGVDLRAMYGTPAADPAPSNSGGGDSWFDDPDTSAAAAPAPAAAPTNGHAAPAAAPGLEKITERFDRLEERLAAADEAERDAQQERGRQVIEAFKAMTDAEGNLVYPYYDDLQGDIEALLRNGMADSLETAYSKASRLNDGVRAKIEAADSAKAAREDQARRREKAAAAERAGASVTGADTGTTSPNPAGSVRDEVARHYYANT